MPPFRNPITVLFCLLATVQSFSLHMMSSSSSSSREIYNIPNSGWTSSGWNWGSARGTGHDCAMICRQRWSTREARSSLIEALLECEPAMDMDNREPPFEEVKLICGLAWQNGRWDGSDGGRGGYGEVLANMAEAVRYETNNGSSSEDEGSVRLVQDMQDRFEKLSPTSDQTKIMKTLLQDYPTDVDVARRKCAGLVLSAMGFVENGL